jgi:hypothetical protein
MARAEVDRLRCSSWPGLSRPSTWCREQDQIRGCPGLRLAEAASAAQAGQAQAWRRKDMRPRPRDGIRPSFAHLFTLLENRGRREGRVAACTRGPRAKDCARSALTTGTGGDTPAFPAQWFYGLYALSPVNHPVCHRHQRDARSIIANLSARSLGRQDHTTSPSAKVPLVSQHHRVHRNFRTTFRDDA